MDCAAFSVAACKLLAKAHQAFSRPSSRSLIRLPFTFGGCQGGAVVKNPGDTVKRLRRQTRDWEEIFAKTFLRGELPKNPHMRELEDYTVALGYIYMVDLQIYQE